MSLLFHGSAPSIPKGRPRPRGRKSCESTERAREREKERKGANALDALKQYETNEISGTEQIIMIQQHEFNMLSSFGGDESSIKRTFPMSYPHFPVEQEAPLQVKFAQESMAQCYAVRL